MAANSWQEQEYSRHMNVCERYVNARKKRKTRKCGSGGAKEALMLSVCHVETNLAAWLSHAIATKVQEP